jgi:hypothetical protein
MPWLKLCATALKHRQHVTPRNTRYFSFGKSFVYVLIASQGPVQFFLSSENCRGVISVSFHAQRNQPQKLLQNTQFSVRQTFFASTGVPTSESVCDVESRFRLDRKPQAESCPARGPWPAADHLDHLTSRDSSFSFWKSLRQRRNAHV